MNEVKQPERKQSSGFAGAIDRFVFALSPERGAKRMISRRMFEAADARANRILQNAVYEGAETSRLRGDKWLGSQLSADSGLESDLSALRSRARELYRSDSVGGAVEARVSHVVGSGIRPQSRIPKAIVGESRAKELNDRLEQLYRNWSLRADRDRKFPMWVLQRLIERNIANDGEALIVLSDVGNASSPVPLCVEVLDVDRLESPPTLSGNKLVRMGIERDASGMIVAYHVRKTHPGDTIDVSCEYDRLPADRVIHIFEPLFAGQSRGLPWMFRVLNRVRDAKDLDEATIIAAQVQACYAAFVKTADPYTESVGNTSSTNSAGQRLTSLEPATIKYLDPNQDVVFANPSQPGATFGPFMEWTYRRIASGLNFAYQFLTKSWEGLSFAGGRLVLAEARTDFKGRQQLLIDMCLRRIWERFVSECVIVGAVDIDGTELIAEPEVYLAHNWITPPWQYAISPGEDVKANIDAINSNQKTLEDILEADGKDPDEHMLVRAREVQLQREMGLLPVDKSAGLNGIQIEAALGVLAALRDNAISDEAAVHMLMSLGFDEEDSRSIVGSMAQLPPPPKQEPEENSNSPEPETVDA